MSSSSGVVTFVLFRFRLFALKSTEAAAVLQVSGTPHAVILASFFYSRVY